MTWRALGGSAAVVEARGIGAGSSPCGAAAWSRGPAATRRSPARCPMRSTCSRPASRAARRSITRSPRWRPHVDGALGARFGACAAQLRSTRPRREVLRALGGEPVRELDRAGHALAAADELGSPLASTLTEQAAMQRELARLGVRERAAAAGPKIALVVAVTLVPSALVLVLGSQALSLLAGV